MMSRGSMGYLFNLVDNANFEETTHLRKVFREHLTLVSRALEAIERNDSGLQGVREDEKIRACLDKGEELEFSVASVRNSMRQLEKTLETIQVEQDKAEPEHGRFREPLTRLGAMVVEDLIYYDGVLMESDHSSRLSRFRDLLIEWELVENDTIKPGLLSYVKRLCNWKD